MRPSALLAATLFAVLLLPGCPRPPGDDDDDDSAVGDDDDDSTPVPFRFWSTDFEDGGEFPEQFSCLGPNPELRWEGEPEGTAALALIFDDPTFGNYPHWAIFNIPAGLGVLEGGIMTPPARRTTRPRARPSSRMASVLSATSAPARRQDPPTPTAGGSGH